MIPPLSVGMSLRPRKEIIGDCTLYLGDCGDIIPTLEDAYEVTALVTDPPYGIKRDKGFEGFEGFGGFGAKIARKKYHGDWDNERPSEALIGSCRMRAKYQVIFGGQFFTDILPVGGHWIVWDKLNTMPTFGDCELAWTNLKRNSVKKFTFEYNGLLGKEQFREHATQKPLELMKWCIQQLPKGAEIVLDPFMGSGTTLVACAKLGKRGIGIEVDEKYFDIACRRVEDAYRQPDMFVEPAKPMIQQSLPD